jgi:hypothetical protein
LGRCLARQFDPHTLPLTLRELAEAQDADTGGAVRDEARREIATCDAKRRQHRAALEAGADTAIDRYATRSRFRRELPDLALNSGNTLAGDYSGHALGTGRLAAEHVLVNRRWCFTVGAATATRFPIMLARVHRRPPPFADCANTIGVNIGERSRTGVNE